MRSTNGRVIPGAAKVGASLQITFSSPVSEADQRIIPRVQLASGFPRQMFSARTMLAIAPAQIHDQSRTDLFTGL
jgi:hypothetical protein